MQLNLRRVDMYNPQRPCPTDRFMLTFYKEYQLFLRTFTESTGDREISKIRSSVVTDHMSVSRVVISTKIVLREEEQAKLDLYLGFFDAYRITRASLIHHMRQPVIDLGPFQFGKEHQDLIHVLIAILKFLIFAMHEGRLTKEDLDFIATNIKGEDLDLLIFKVMHKPTEVQAQPLKGLRPFNYNLSVYEDYDSDLIKAFYNYIWKTYEVEEAPASSGETRVLSNDFDI